MMSQSHHCIENILGFFCFEIQHADCRFFALIYPHISVAKEQQININLTFDRQQTIIANKDKLIQ